MITHYTTQQPLPRVGGKFRSNQVTRLFRIPKGGIQSRKSKPFSFDLRMLEFGRILNMRREGRVLELVKERRHDSDRNCASAGWLRYDRGTWQGLPSNR